MPMRALAFAGSTALKVAAPGVYRARAQCGLRRFTSMSNGKEAPPVPAQCVGCEGLTETLSKAELDSYSGVLADWAIVEDGTKLTKVLRAKNFSLALDYVNKIGALAESEGHHPDLHLYGYNNVEVELSTHSLGGLTVNDIVMAVKVDALPLPPLSKRPPELRGPGRK